MIAKITSKGQITIPVEIRRRLKLKTGDRLEFALDGDQTVIRPAAKQPVPFRKYIGAWKGAFPGGIKEINAWIAEMRSGEPTVALQERSDKRNRH